MKAALREELATVRGERDNLTGKVTELEGSTNALVEEKGRLEEQLSMPSWK